MCRFCPLIFAFQFLGLLKVPDLSERSRLKMPRLRFCTLLRPNPHWMRPHNARKWNLCESKCPHCTQATSKDLRSNLCARARVQCGLGLKAPIKSVNSREQHLRFCEVGVLNVPIVFAGSRRWLVSVPRRYGRWCATTRTTRSRRAAAPSLRRRRAGTRPRMRTASPSRRPCSCTPWRWTPSKRRLVPDSERKNIKTSVLVPLCTGVPNLGGGGVM